MGYNSRLLDYQNFCNIYSKLGEIICLRCGGNIHRNYKYPICRYLRRKFCSKSCSIKYSDQGFKKGERKRAGIPHTKETKRKISESKKAYYEEKSKAGIPHHNWKGGYEHKIFLNSRRVASKHGADGSHTQQEWEEIKKEHDFKCVFCQKQEPEITLSEDHIIPLSKGGSDNIDNIQPLCRSCNSKKGNKFISFISLVN